MTKIILSDSYYNLFDILLEQLNGVNQAEGSNLIFCEEKSSLTVERKICAKFNGSFNTEVYSFGNFMRVHCPSNKTLTKEGSSMVVKKLLKELPLSTLGLGKEIAPSLYELIAQLKSASVTVSDLEKATVSVNGILKNKLIDVVKIYRAYEEYLTASGVSDQSQALSRFPELIESMPEIKGANVFLVGYTGLTKQNLQGVKALIKNARSFTAILPFSSENQVAFVNETCKTIEDLCIEINEKYEKIFIKTPYNEQANRVASSLFNYKKLGEEKIENSSVHFFCAKDNKVEAEKVASVIRQQVEDGKRYKDFTVIIPENYDKTVIKDAFSLLDVPCYIDCDYKADHHPLISLIFSYIDVFLRNYEKETVLSFIKNPLFSQDKALNDCFVNYVYKYNVNYQKFLKAFTFATEENVDLESLNKLRERFVSLFNSFDVNSMLKELNAEQKLIDFSNDLDLRGENEVGAVTRQIYSKVIGILEEIQSILGKNVSIKEFKEVFLSGISALKLNIIPQYNDAVFIGGFKEAGLWQAKTLFALGLTFSVPSQKEDVSLLTDWEIDLLSEVKVQIAPKIKIVNHRTREEIVAGLSSFSEALYLSYPVNTYGNEKHDKSQIIKFFEENFVLKEFEQTKVYLTEKQGLRSFALDCCDFVELQKGDIEDAVSFYSVVGQDKAGRIIERANSEIKISLDKKSALVSEQISPTTVEEYYKCPYRAFINHALGVKEREEGEVTGVAIGNVMHDVFYSYVKNVGSVSDEESSHNLFLNVVEGIKNDTRYEKFFTDSQTQTLVELALEECEKHCFRTYGFLSQSNFRAHKEDLERSFDISVGDGSVNLHGKIDRVDRCGEYFRVVDYKTGKVDDGDDSLYAGNKLQLYLYALAIKDKKLAGAYYFDVSDEFKKQGEKRAPYFKGKTLNDREVIDLQDRKVLSEGSSTFLPITVKDGEIKGAIGEKTIKAYLKYAEAMCVNAVKQMIDGVIVASPLKGTCAWCKYKAICFSEGRAEREIGKVTEEVIENAIYKGEEDA